MSYISRHPLQGNLADPHPFIPAFITASGKSIVYDCPWCQRRHRHRAFNHPNFFTKGYTIPQTHCEVWRRLYRVKPFSGPDYVRLFRPPANWTQTGHAGFKPFKNFL